MAKKSYAFELWQDGVMVASAWATDVDSAWREIMHYARMYAKDGPVQVCKEGVGPLAPRALTDDDIRRLWEKALQDG